MRQFLLLVILTMAFLDLILGSTFPEFIWIRYPLRGIILAPVIIYLVAKKILRNTLLNYVAILVAVTLITLTRQSSYEIFTPEFIWYVLLLFMIIPKSNRLIEKKQSTNYPLLLTCIVIGVLSIISNFGYKFYKPLELSNPNALCALCGISLVIISIIPTKKTTVKIFTKYILFSAIILSFSRVGYIWALLGIFLSTKTKSFLHKFTRLFLSIFIMFSFTFILVTSSPLYQPVAIALEVIEFNWRFSKGDSTESDLRRLKYYPSVVHNNLWKQSFYLYGEGFGVRSYKESLPPGEDVHSAYLTMLNDGGIIALIIFLVLGFLLNLRNRKSNPLGIATLTFLSSAAFFPGPIYGNQYLSLAFFFTISNYDKEI